MADDFLGHFESAARPGRGEKTCLCCQGNGSHPDGSECDPCDESGLLHSNEEQRYCPGQPLPRRRRWRQPRGAYETATPEARERRHDRASAWLDRNTSREGTVDIPAHWGPQVGNDVIHHILDTHGWPRDESDREDHWSHIDPEQFPTNQVIHHHQGFVLPDVVKDKMAWSSEGSMHPDDQPAKIVRHEGKDYLLDGHHKWAGARLLGHEGFEAHVFDTSRPETYPEHCPECSEEDDDDLAGHFEGARTASAVPAAERTESVRHILDNYLPSDYDTWDEARENLDYNHSPQLRALTDDIRQNGVRRPVPIDYEQDPPRVMNGHTRLISAERAGAETVPTRQHQGFMDPDDPDHMGRQPDDPLHYSNWTEHEAGLEVAAPAMDEPSSDYKEILGHFEAADSSLYHGVHVPPGGPDDDPEWLAPMHDVRNAMPRGYEAPREYPGWDAESGRQLQAAEGKPDHPVTIYRALPAGRREINTGDWVTTSGAYARTHGEGNLRHTPWHVVKADVPARHLFNEGYMSEWGYQGPHVGNAAVHYVGDDHDRRDDDLGPREAAVDDYRMTHGAPNPAAGHKPLYHYTGEDPDDRVRIYRAAPVGTEAINSGDWVSRNPAYAHRHGYGEGPGGSDWPVYTAEVHQKHVHWDENDEDEHGYNGPEIWHPDVHDAETGELHDWDSYHDAHPHGREAWIGSAVHMPQADHDFVHDPYEDEEDRANRLLGHAHAQGALHAAHWRGDDYDAKDDAVERARQAEAPEGHRVTMFHGHRKDDGRLADLSVKEYSPAEDEPWRGGWRMIDTEETYPNYSHQALDEAGRGREATAPARWYHATNEELPDGAQVLPAAQVGRGTRGGPGDGNHAWVSNDPIRAGAYGANIYEVTPSATPRHTRGPDDEHQVPSATVVRKVPFAEARTLSPSYQAGAAAYEHQRALQAEAAAATPDVSFRTSKGRRQGIAHTTVNAYVGDSKVGYARMIDQGRTLDDLYVHPDHRGSGLGHALMGEVVRQFGHNPLHLYASPFTRGRKDKGGLDNDQLQGFYAQHGFTPVEGGGRNMVRDPSGATTAALEPVVAVTEDDDELPADPGTMPIPAGHIRLWHYTPMENAPSIREHGLLFSKARSDLGNGDLSEPSAGVWASTKRPDELLDNHDHARGVVEFHAHPSEISGNAESPWHAMDRDRNWDDAKVQDWASGYHHVIMHGDVHPSRILAVHEPWHGAARYMRDDDPTLGNYQWIKDEPDEEHNAHLRPYRRALNALERQRRVGMVIVAAEEPVRYFHGTNAEHAPGAVLTAAEALTAAPGGAAANAVTQGRTPHVFFTTDYKHAAMYASVRAQMHGGTPHVYEVHPQGDFEPNPADERTRDGKPPMSFRSTAPLAVSTEVLEPPKRPRKKRAAKAAAVAKPLPPAPRSLGEVLATANDAVGGLWLPETPSDWGELLDGFPGFFGALADGLDLLGARLDDCPVDEHLPAVAHSMATACRTAADDATEINQRVRTSFMGGVNG